MSRRGTLCKVCRHLRPAILFKYDHGLCSNECHYKAVKRGDYE